MANVAIVGRPNVGKSALFNRIAGKRIAIVHGEPGITRDRLAIRCEANGKIFTLWDTGGVIGRGESELSGEVRSSAERAIKDSAVILFVVDAQDGLTPIDRELARLLRRARKPVVLVVNKIDDPKHEDRAAEFSELGFEKSFSVSAAHGRNVIELIAAIAALLPERQSEEAQQISTIKVAIVGRPNAGKSSLINTLLRDRRAIVSEAPGTTRDAIDIEYEHDGNRYVLIDTAGIRPRSKHSSSVEVFSVMRAEKTIKRADVCVLAVDAVEEAKAQDRRIAALIQKSRKPCLIVLNKWDLIRPVKKQREFMEALIARTYAELFFLTYAPMLVTSALTGEHSERIFKLIERIRHASSVHIGTGKLNRLLRAAFASNPPPMVSGKRLKLFYGAQSGADSRQQIPPPEFVLFVNSPRLLTEPFARFLEARIRETESYTGLPIVLTLRPRTEGQRERK